MKKYLLVITSLGFWLSALSQVLKPVDDESSVKFRIKNFGFSVTGSFKGLQGTIQFNPDNLPGSSMDVTVQTKSVNSGVDMRDNHLRKEDYFDVKNYPVMRFASTRITPSSKSGTLFMFGKLTIKNVSREISFPFTAVARQDGYLFTGEFKINRIDFGVGESSSVGDNLTVMLKVFARK
ncbi:MAG: YceI family protein [Chitinophagaceae bacterium]|nr:YceI family protein [Chitinophagaceae bacterium]